MSQTVGRNPNLRLVGLAKGFIGTLEEGNNDGPIIRAIQKEVFGIADHQAYCVAWIQHLVRQVEKEFEIKSKLFFSGSVLQTYLNSLSLKVAAPEPGDLGFYKTSDTTGHAVVVRKPTSLDTFTSIEGNTSKGVAGSQREGDGFWGRNRTTRSVPGWQFLGFLRVFPKEGTT